MISWINLDDVVAIIIFLLKNYSYHVVYNLTAPDSAYFVALKINENNIDSVSLVWVTERKTLYILRKKFICCIYKLEVIRLLYVWYIRFW